MSHKSISDRLKKARSPQATRATIYGWIDGWRSDQEAAIRALDAAIDDMDRDALTSAAGQLHQITRKKFAGLKTIMERLLRLAFRSTDTSSDKRK